MRYLFVLLLFFPYRADAQQWVDMMHDRYTNFYQVQQAFEQAWQGRPYERGNGWKQFKRWEWYMEPRVYPSGNRFNLKSAYEEREQFMRDYGQVSRSANWLPLGPANWLSTSYNPGNGRINEVHVDPQNNNILYAGSPSGGLWKSSNAGSSWTPLGDAFSAMGVSGIAIDHQNSNVIYISTGDGNGADTYSIGVLKSTDGGNSWTPTGLLHSIGQGVVSRRLKMHPTNNQILLVATNDGLYKTADAGTTWTQVLSGSIRDVEFKPGAPSTVYACSDVFFRSTDGGNTFTQVSTGLPSASDVNRMSIAVSANNPSVVYALTGAQGDASFYGLYRSNNSGASFSLTTSTPNMFGYEDDGSGSGGQSWYDMAMTVDPNNANRVVIGGINVWGSTDGGNSFTILSHWIYPSAIGYTHADIHTLEYFGNVLYCGSDGGLFTSTDHGNNWSDISSGMEITQFYRMGSSPQNAGLIAAGAQDNGSNLWNGTQWTHVLGADGMEAAISPTNQSIIYVATQNGGLNRSTDGGNTFNGIAGSINENGGWVTPYLVLPANLIYAGYQNVWRSTNGGSTWNVISNFSGNATIRDMAACQSNTNVIALYRDGNLLRTTNGGNSWQSINSNLPVMSITDIQIHPVYQDVMWVTTSGFSGGEKVFATTDGGSNWTNVSANLPNLPANCIVYQEGTNGGLYVGMDVGIYYTDSTLSNWQPFDQGLPNVIVNELEIQYGAGKLRAATYGRGIWQSDLYSPSTLPPVASFSTTEGLLCPGDSIPFTDASLNASPGWTWYFPGGSPSNSTLQSPWVTYPTNGTYTASLVVQNANGTDSTSKTLQVSFGTTPIQVDILTDNYPTETSWSIYNAGSQFVAEGGGYGQANTLYSQLVCLDTGCYVFTISDSYGDGICCAYGTGSYQVERLDSNIVIADGGAFGSAESASFCITAPVSTTDVSIVNEAALSIYPNPAEETLHVRWKSESFTWQISDLTGKILQTGQHEGVLNLDLRTLPAGKYLIRLRADNDAVTATFVKMDN